MNHRILYMPIVILLGLTSTASGKTWMVTPAAGLANAVAMADAGDTLLIQQGLFEESGIIIDKRLAIIGDRAGESAGSARPVIDGRETAQIITINADDVRIEGLEIANVGLSYMEDRAAIKLTDVSGCVIQNNRLRNGFFGIYLENSSDCTIRGNEISAQQERETSSGNGIHLWYCRDIIVDRNRITGHRDGIYFEFVESSVITNNVSENNLRYGLHFMFSNHDRYEMNVFRENGAGVAVMFSDEVTMRNNRFEKNWGSASYGLLLKDIRDSEIIGNLFRRNTIGLYSEGSMRLDIERNVFRENGYAMKIMSSSAENRISTNNFVSNTFDISTNSRHNFNTFDGNYWSGYQGYDLDRDGVGDVPHRPVHLFSLLVEREPAGLILLRSFFIDLIDAAEQVMPIYTPPTLLDSRPLVYPIALGRDLP